MWQVEKAAIPPDFSDDTPNLLHWLPLALKFVNDPAESVEIDTANLVISEGPAGVRHVSIGSGKNYPTVLWESQFLPREEERVAFAGQLATQFKGSRYGHSLAGLQKI